VNLCIYRLQWLTFYDIYYAHADLVPISRRLGISDSNWENHVEGAVSRFESLYCLSCWITSEIYSFFFFFSFFFRDSARLHFDYYPASSRPLTGKGQPNRQVLTINALDMIAPVRSSSPTNSKILNKPILSFKDAMEGIC
jgi:hypothetical protein